MEWTRRDNLRIDRIRDRVREAKKELTAREQEVFIELLTDRSHQEIAESMYIAVPTVKKHTSRIFHKLGVQNRRELLARFLGEEAFG